MPEPLVSVLINNYNYGRFLAEAIESALSQTYGNTEVIVVDDGSTDNSHEVIASYGNRIVPVLKQNGGQASAFNSGFEASRGQIICLLDSDDIWEPEKIKYVTAAFESDANLSLVYHRVQAVNTNYEAVGRPFPRTLLSGDISQNVWRSGGYWRFPPTTALSITRRAMERIYPIPEVFRVCADAFVADLAPFIGFVRGIPRSLAKYRQHPANTWSTGVDSQARLAAALQMYETRVFELNKALQKLGIPAKTVELARHWPYRATRYLCNRPGDSLAALSLEALNLPFEPDYRRRLVGLVRFWQRCRNVRSLAENSHAASEGRHAQ